MLCLLACAPLVVSLPASAGDVPADAEGMTEEAAPEETMMESTPLVKDTDVSIYGRFWPRLTYENSDGSSTDITDALSRVGIKSSTQITESLSAVLHGEWDVDIEQNGNFGDARLAYVGIKSEGLGMVAIGKQWDPYFNTVAEVTDIFYHRASPFGYDNQGPFRSGNLVTYANSFAGFNITAGMQVDGEVGNGDDSASHGDNVDAASVGASFSAGPIYIGASYLRQNKDDDMVERNFLGIGGSLNVMENLYLAATYQYITDNYDDGSELNPYTLDLAAAYSFGSVKALLGFFTSDPDDGNELMGYNITLIKEVHPALDVFAEWVLTDKDQGDDVNTLSLGFRYDFD
jgi:predicted porin